MKFYKNEITGTQTSFFTNIAGKRSFVPSFLSASSAATYLFTAPTWRTTIVTLQPCALNAEFQAFRTENLIKFPYFADTTDSEMKEGIGG
jgi:hypothetical protein